MGFKETFTGGIPIVEYSCERSPFIWNNIIACRPHGKEKMLCIVDSKWKQNIVVLEKYNVSSRSNRSAKMYSKLAILLKTTTRFIHSSPEEICRYLNNYTSYVYIPSAELYYDPSAIIMIMPGQPRVVSYVDSPIGESCLRKLNQYLVAYNLLLYL